MKKINGLLCISTLLLLSGCSDAVANISDGSTVLFKVGDESTTKADLYNLAKTSNAGTAATSLVKQQIYEAEVPATADMEAEAKKTLDAVKENSGDKFQEMLTSNGYQNEDDYYKEVALGNVQARELTKKYLNEENKLSDYQPIKAQVLIATSEEKANDAATAIGGGKDFKEAVSEYGDSTKSEGSEKVYFSMTGLPSNVWNTVLNTPVGSISGVIADTANNAFYVVKVLSTTLEDFKEDAITAMTGNSTIASEAFVYYLEKHDFEVWDIDTYNQLKASSPTYLIQDK